MKNLQLSRGLRRDYAQVHDIRVRIERVLEEEEGNRAGKMSLNGVFEPLFIYFLAFWIWEDEDPSSQGVSRVQNYLCTMQMQMLRPSFEPKPHMAFHIHLLSYTNI